MVSEYRRGRAKWIEEDFEPTVKAYIEMLELQRRGKKFVKEEFYRDLSLLLERSPGAFQFKMENISHVYYSCLGMERIDGLTPYKPNDEHISLIKELIYKHDPELSNSS